MYKFKKLTSIDESLNTEALSNAARMVDTIIESLIPGAVFVNHGHS